MSSRSDIGTSGGLCQTYENRIERDVGVAFGTRRDVHLILCLYTLQDRTLGQSVSSAACFAMRDANMTGMRSSGEVEVVSVDVDHMASYLHLVRDRDGRYRAANSSHSYGDRKLP